MCESSPPSLSPQPSWRLDDVARVSIEEPKSSPTWRLSILLPEGCPEPPSLIVDHSHDELRLEAAKMGRWRLPVPDYARPVHSPVCKLWRQKRELWVEWLGDEQRATAHSSTQLGKTDFQDETQAVAEDTLVQAEDRDAERNGTSCHWCGAAGAVLLCTKCRAAQYCSENCQKAAWIADHRSRCPLSSRALAAKRQHKRGDTELAIATLEDAIREAVQVAKSEAAKEFTYDHRISAAIFRGVASLIVPLSAALADISVPDAKFCRASFLAIGCFLDMAAALGEERIPEEVQFHLDLIVSGLGEKLNPDADPVLSAWMFYDSFSRGLQDRPSHYFKKVKQIKVGALVGLRDVLAASHDILQASQASIDQRLASKADELLDCKALQISRAGFNHLIPYWPKGEAEGAFPDADLDVTQSDSE